MRLCSVPLGSRHWGSSLLGKTVSFGGPGCWEQRLGASSSFEQELERRGILLALRRAASPNRAGTALRGSFPLRPALLRAARFVANRESEALRCSVLEHQVSQLPLCRTRERACSMAEVPDDQLRMATTPCTRAETASRGFVCLFVPRPIPRGPKDRQSMRAGSAGLALPPRAVCECWGWLLCHSETSVEGLSGRPCSSATKGRNCYYTQALKDKRNGH